MDPLRAHFLILVGQLGVGARLAKLPMEIVMSDGREYSGVPVPHQDEGDGVDDTGFARWFGIGDEVVALDEIVEVRLRSAANAEMGPEIL